MRSPGLTAVIPFILTQEGIEAAAGPTRDPLLPFVATLSCPEQKRRAGSLCRFRPNLAPRTFHDGILYVTIEQRWSTSLNIAPSWPEPLPQVVRRVERGGRPEGDDSSLSSWTRQLLQREKRWGRRLRVPNRSSASRMSLCCRCFVPPPSRITIRSPSLPKYTL